MDFRMTFLLKCGFLLETFFVRGLPFGKGSLQWFPNGFVFLQIRRTSAVLNARLNCNSRRNCFVG